MSPLQNLTKVPFKVIDISRNYTVLDFELLIDIFKSELNFLKSNWQNILGRPLVIFFCHRNYILGKILVKSNTVRMSFFKM